MGNELMDKYENDIRIARMSKLYDPCPDTERAVKRFGNGACPFCAVVTDWYVDGTPDYDLRSGGRYSSKSFIDMEAHCDNCGRDWHASFVFNGSITCYHEGN